MFGVNIVVIALVVGVFAAFYVYKIYRREEHKSWLQWFILALNMECAILWLSTAAGAIVDLIEVKVNHKFTSVINQMNPVILGASLMAIGNSLGDFYNNSSLSSIGLAVMACTGTISGQVFNLLLGFGINLLRQTWRAHGTDKVQLFQKVVEFNLFHATDPDEKKSAIFTVTIISSCIVVLTALGIWSYRHNSLLNKRVGAWLVLSYLGIIPVCLLVYILG